MLGFRLALVLEVVSVVLLDMVLELGVGDIVAPASHLGVLDGGLHVGEPHLKVVALRVEWIVRGRGPLHQWRLEGALRIEVDDPVLPDGLVLRMVVHVLLLRHVDSCDLVLVPNVVRPAVGRDVGTATAADTHVRSHRHADFVHVSFVRNLILLNSHSL